MTQQHKEKGREMALNNQPGIPAMCSQRKHLFLLSINRAESASNE